MQKRKRNTEQKFVFRSVKMSGGSSEFPGDFKLHTVSLNPTPCLIRDKRHYHKEQKQHFPAASCRAFPASLCRLSVFRETFIARVLPPWKASYFMY